jgi:glutamine cyclotransferase
MATMQQPGAEDRAGVQLDSRPARRALVALTILAAAIGAAVVFTQSRAQKTTTVGITATLRFSGAPDPIAAGTDALWVALNPAFDRGLQTQRFGSLERVNLTSGAVERTLRIPGFVGPGILHLGKKLWVTHNVGPNGAKPGQLEELDWNSGKLLGRIPFERGAFGLAYGDGSLWVTVGRSPATLVRVDPATRRTIGKPIIVTPQRSFASAFGSGAVWATGFDDGSLARVDPATGRVERIRVGGAAVGVTVSGGCVWVVDRDRRMVIRVDPRTLRVLHTTTVGDEPADVVTGGGLVWVVNQSDGTVTRINARTGKTVGEAIRITPDDAARLAVAGRSLWVTSDKHRTATRIDLNQTR